MGCSTSSDAQVHSSNETEENKENAENTSKEKVEPKDSKEKAATKIQAAFRGHKIRTSMKQAAKPDTASSSAEPTREELEAEFRPDDKELCSAASKIQASFRGKAEARKQAEIKKKSEDELADIDLADPDLNKAATKIQASFRGHKVRKEVDN